MSHLRKVTTLLPHSVRFTLRQVGFYGHGEKCVLCGNSVRQFRSHGGGAEVLDRRKVVGGMRRDDDRCPVCHGRDRTRLMMHYLEKHTNIGKAPMRVLHVAPDYGLYLWLRRQPNVSYVATDLDISRYRHMEGMVMADVTKLPFKKESFDVVICSHVLEHVPDDCKAMREFARVLRPGGIAILLTPYALDGLGTDESLDDMDAKARDERFGQWDHVRIYDRGDFVARMTEAGFSVELYDPFAHEKADAERLHLNPLEILPVGHK